MSEIEIRRENLYLPAIVDQACCHFELARMTGQFRRIGELVDQPEAGHIGGRNRVATEMGSMVRSWCSPGGKRPLIQKDCRGVRCPKPAENQVVCQLV